MLGTYFSVRPESGVPNIKHVMWTFLQHGFELTQPSPSSSILNFHAPATTIHDDIIPEVSEFKPKSSSSGSGCNNAKEHPYNPCCNPLPLEPHHVQEMVKHPTSYVVSEKTDGMRALLWLGRRTNTSGQNAKRDLDRACGEFIDRDLNVYKVLMQRYSRIHKAWCGVTEDNNQKGTITTIREEPVTPAAPKQSRTCWFLLDGEWVEEMAPPSLISSIPITGASNSNGVSTGGAVRGLEGSGDVATKKSFIFSVFDVIIAHGRSCARLPLVQRRELLAKTMQESPCPWFAEAIKSTKDKFQWTIVLKPIYPLSLTTALWKSVQQNYLRVSSNLGSALHAHHHHHQRHAIFAQSSADICSELRPICHASDGLIFTPTHVGIPRRKRALDALYIADDQDDHAFSVAGGRFAPILKHKPITTLDALMKWQTVVDNDGNASAWRIGLYLTDDRFASAFARCYEMALIWIHDPQLNWKKLYGLPAPPTLDVDSTLRQWLLKQDANGSVVCEFIIVSGATGIWRFMKPRPDKKQPNAVSVCVKTLKAMMNPAVLSDLDRISTV